MGSLEDKARSGCHLRDERRRKGSGERKKVGGERMSTAHQLARDSSLEGRDKAILAPSNHASITMLIGHLGKVPIINRQMQRR